MAKSESIILGGGCFWCLDATYRLVRGINKVVSGYAGGTVPNPTYEQLFTQETGHAEVVRLDFNPAIISLENILDIFWSIHDPTTLNRQGNDVGSQYRSIILYTDKNQQKVIDRSLKKAREIWGNVVTEVMPAEKFYPAEDYHQNYFANNPEKAYCQIVINPKLEKLRNKFAERLKTS